MSAPSSTVFNEDCLVGLKQFPDQFFDLAICDPPYGLGFSTYERYGYKGKEHLSERYAKKDWDKGVPGPEFFKELFRVSKEQIVWGGNYFDLPTSPGWICWDKEQHLANFAAFELAWSSFDRPAIKAKFRYYGSLEGGGVGDGRIHPTQKPVELYQWQIRTFAKKNGHVLLPRLLDPMMGSQTSRIAAFLEGFDYWGWERDADYFVSGCKHFETKTKQQILNL